MLDRFQAEAAFRLQVLAWAVFAVIVAGSVLTHSNPFRLLVPGLAYSFPRLDHRQEIRYFTLSRKDLSLVERTEKMERTGQLEQDARHLAFILRKPFALVQGRTRPSADGYFFPSYDLGIQRMWLKGDELLIDMDASFLNREYSHHARAASATGESDEARQTAQMFQTCLTLTIFENFPEVKRITYLPDGLRVAAGYAEVKRDDLEGLLKKEDSKDEKKGEGKKAKKSALTTAVMPFDFDHTFTR